MCCLLPIWRFCTRPPAATAFTQCADCVTLAASIDTALKIVKGKGRVIIVGYPRRPLTVDIMALVDMEVEMVGSYGWTFEDAMAVVYAVSAKKIRLEQIVTSVISLDGLPSIFERLYSKDNADIKGVIKLWQKHQYPRVCIAEQI